MDQVDRTSLDQIHLSYENMLMSLINFRHLRLL